MKSRLAESEKQLEQSRCGWVSARQCTCVVPLCDGGLVLFNRELGRQRAEERSQGHQTALLTAHRHAQETEQSHAAAVDDLQARLAKALADLALVQQAAIASRKEATVGQLSVSKRAYCRVCVPVWAMQ